MLEGTVQWVNAAEARVASELRKPRRAGDVLELIGGDDVVGERLGNLAEVGPDQAATLLKKYELDV